MHLCENAVQHGGMWLPKDLWWTTDRRGQRRDQGTCPWVETISHRIRGIRICGVVHTRRIVVTQITMRLGQFLVIEVKIEPNDHGAILSIITPGEAHFDEIPSYPAGYRQK